MDNFVEKLPTELLFLIFKHLNTTDIENCSKTCIKWRKIIAKFFLKSYLFRLTKLDTVLKNLLHKNGWNEESDDIDHILKYYEKSKAVKQIQSTYIDFIQGAAVKKLTKFV